MFHHTDDNIIHNKMNDVITADKCEYGKLPKSHVAGCAIILLLSSTSRNILARNSAMKLIKAMTIHVGELPKSHVACCAILISI